MNEGATGPGPTGNTLWHGRFEGGPARVLMDFTASLPFDVRLAACDIRGSMAHVRGLARVGLLTAEEEAAVLDALEQAGAELADGRFTFVESDEDVHTAIERRVTELAPEAGGKLHTGRSRNDQVATAFRLWTKEAMLDIAGLTMNFQHVLIDKARLAGEAYLPGYTHLQRAQPVPLAHHLLAHAWALGRDVDRLLATAKRLNVSPLGAGALAGTSLPLDPVSTAVDLGFDRPFTNSLDVTSDRDFVAEALFTLAVLGVHLSRMGEEFVLWSSQEFGFVTLDDGYATGSSMMPQKKNPDIAELTRGKTGRLIGNLTSLLVTLKGLPLAYNRDLQEDKEPLFDSYDQISLALVAFGGMMETASFNTVAMAAAADDQTSLATDLAEILVEQGVPFREAHAIVGGLVRDSLGRGVPLSDLVGGHPAFPDSVAFLFAPGAAVSRRASPGGAGAGPVAEQFKQIEADMARSGSRLRTIAASLEPSD
ncbi:MAG: argininosuccinate lyase [Acidimicrobiia bacterium]|nr:argininosuccinate lyase [Acidimicrobiia bacterium]